MENFIEIKDTVYSVSNLGNVKNNTTNRILKGKLSKSGYLYVDLWVNGIVKQNSIHRLVAEYFVDNQNQYNEVNHIDENKLNNNASNLEWCTHLKNMRHGTAQQRKAQSKQIKVKQFTKQGEFIREFDSCKDAEKHFGKSSSNISNCCRNRLKTAYGYIWKYSEETQSEDDLNLT